MPAPLMVSSHKVRTPVAFVDLESPLLRDRYGINIKGPLARTAMWVSGPLTTSIGGRAIEGS